MTIFARVKDGAVAELLTTDLDITKLFHPTLEWVEVTSPVHVGWLQQGASFVPPPPLPATLRTSTPAEFQVRLSVLAAEIAVLQAQH